MASDRGPLAGVRIVEIAGLGPAPFCGMMLADHGAEVIRVDRPTPGSLDTGDAVADVLNRSRRGIVIDLKQPDGKEVVRRLCASADGLIEGFRPGVMERLGLSPEVLIGDNPRLVYGRMTGWGQTGPLAQAAGHDINYIALSGALHAIGKANAPVPPLNLVGDFGGGGMMLAFGMLAAILSARETGRGQVVDCAMTEGSAVLMAMMYSLASQRRWRDEREANLLDGGAPFYGTYETADSLHLAVGPVEPQFYRLLIDRMGLADDNDFARRDDPGSWPELRRKLAARFREKTREEWCVLLEGTDACVAPVLSMAEAPEHPHNAARGAFVVSGGVTQPAPAPRYSATPTADPRPLGPDADALLAELGCAPGEIERWRSAGVIA